MSMTIHGLSLLLAVIASTSIAPFNTSGLVLGLAPANDS